MKRAVYRRSSGVRVWFAAVLGLSLGLVTVVEAQDAEERLFWETVRCHEEGEVRVYLEEFPGGAYVDQATECLQDIARSQDDGDSEQGGDDAAEPDSADQIADRLAQCQAHLEADRLTSGEGGTALECYQAVLAMDADNAEALAGLKRIEDTYAKWARSAVEAGDGARAERNLDKLERLNPEHAMIPELTEAIAELDKQPARQPFEPEMVRIEGGCFQMGSPESEPGRDNDERRHRVCVEDFSMGKYEVTQDQWQAVMGDNPSTFQGEDRPVEQVSWHDVQDYIDKLNAQTGKAHRLPTEAEWEYAARAGTDTSRYWGDDPGRACQYGNVHDRRSKRENGFSWPAHECEDGYAQSAPVGRFKANSYGLYDMLGNVSEWTCSDYGAETWHELNNNKDYDGRETRCVSNAAVRDPVLRGGSWYHPPGGVRSASRTFGPPGLQNSNAGFRVVQD